jgi:hypothetical protein
MVHEFPDPLHQDTIGNAQHGHGLPEVAPAPCKHARLHRLTRLQERQHVLEKSVWERADDVGAGPCRNLLALRHAVEQAASAQPWPEEDGVDSLKTLGSASI